MIARRGGAINLVIVRGGWGAPPGSLRLRGDRSPIGEPCSMFPSPLWLGGREAHRDALL